jgi:geranylgeranyl diphosphate synthase, type II
MTVSGASRNVEEGSASAAVNAMSSMPAEPLKVLLAQQAQRVEEELERRVPAEGTWPSTIHKAMRYSLFAGGKRIRPLLCIEAARVIREQPEGIEAAACSLELIHTYSLIHDDLPALDNDDLRRGKPTCHKVFGEAMAILAGDALLTLAFEVLATLPHAGDTVKARLIAELAIASGTVGGMIGGQVADLEGERQEPTPELLESIHRAKTGALLRASLRMGAIYAGADEAQLRALSAYGEHVGLAFQIVDDLLDVEASSTQLGKTAGKDAAQHKITFPLVYGLEASRRMADEERGRAHAALAPFGERAAVLRGIADLIVHRSA